MGDDDPNKQLVPSQNDPDEMDELFEDNEEFEAQLDGPTASTGDIGDQVPVENAARVILSQDDVAFVHDVLGVESVQEMDPDQEEQHDVHESIEDDLEPETEQPEHGDIDTFEHADADLEPEQQAQRISHEPIDHDETMEDAANAPDDAAPNALVVIPQPNEDNIDVNDSSSLFVPERYSSSHSPAPVPLPPRLNAVPPRQSSIPAHTACSKFSVFTRVREMQKKAQERKAALSRATPTRMSEDVDPETYLNAVTAGITPPAGAFPQPTVDPDEMAHRVALAEFQKQKKHYEGLSRQNGGKLNFRHDVEWMRIQGAEHARIKKRQRELAEIRAGEEQDLFPSVRNRSDEVGEESDDMLQAEGPSRKRRRGEQPRKPAKSLDFQEAELQSMQVALEADKDNPKKKKKGNTGDTGPQASHPTSRSRGSKSKSSRAPRSRAARKATKGPRKTAKDRKELEHATRQATSLFNANVFEQQAGMGAADQPTFRGMNKAEALKELIASVPVADKKQARSDMNSLLAASKDFDGRLACKLAPGNNGNWIVRGMKTSLKGYQVLGTAFMRRRENSSDEPRGGLMADQMGLGKTLMMLGKSPRELLTTLS